MNQNPDIVCTPNSITLEIMKDLHLLKKTDVFENFPDHQSLDNVLDSVYVNYYKDWPQKYIIDRGPVTIPANLELMQKHFKHGFKCIVLLRDLMDVLASYMQWYTENPDAFINKYGDTTDEQKLSRIMNKDGAVAKELDAIQNSYNYPEICHFIKYDNLVQNPEEEINKVYNFFQIPFFKHKFFDLDQIQVNGLGYNDGTFDTKDVNKHQLDSYHLIMKNKAETLTSGSSQPEVFNVLGQLQTIERVKKSGEMIYNKKEQLTHDLGAKEK